jgi:hypothetical protein
MGGTYTVDSCDELFLMKELADCYRCLPILSYSMDRALLNSPRLSNELEDNVRQAFVFAANLRNLRLFRYILIHIVNPWSQPMYLSLSDPKLRKAGQR